MNFVVILPKKKSNQIANDTFKKQTRLKENFRFCLNKLSQRQKKRLAVEDASLKT